MNRGDDDDDDIFSFRGFFNSPFGGFDAFTDPNEMLKQMDRFFEEALQAPSMFGSMKLDEPMHGNDSFRALKSSRNPLRDSVLRNPDSNIRKSSDSPPRSYVDSASSGIDHPQNNNSNKSSWSDWLFGGSQQKRNEEHRDAEVHLDTVLKAQKHDTSRADQDSPAGYAQRTVTRIERRADGSIVKRRTVTYSDGREQSFVEESGPGSS